MTRRGHLLFGLGVTAITGLSIWFSVAIPHAREQKARAQVQQLVSQVKQQGGESCPLDSAALSHSVYLKSMVVASEGCEITLHLNDSAPVEPALRGARLTLAWRPSNSGNQQEGWRCQASGGHNANPADFPASCRFQAQDPLL